MNYSLHRFKFLSAILSLIIFFITEKSFSQQPQNTPALPKQYPSSQVHIPQRPPAYLLSLTPKHGGREFNMMKNTKVKVTLNNGVVAKGKVSDIQSDSLSIDYKCYPLGTITSLSYNPGTVAGSAAGLATVAGLTAATITAGGGKDKVMSDSEKDFFWGGLGLAVVGGALMIPNYFIKKNFSKTDYDFQTVRTSY